MTIVGRDATTRESVCVDDLPAYFPVHTIVLAAGTMLVVVGSV